MTTDYWRRGVEWVAGVADQLTGGLFRTQFGRWLLNSSGYGLLTGGDLSLGGFINTQSGSYQAGQQAGQVVQIALTVWTPGGWLGVAANALRGYQLAGGLAQAGDAALAGRWTDAGWMAGQSIAMFAIQAGPCVVGAAAKGWTASKAAGEFAGSVAEFAAVWVTRGVSVVQGVGSGVQGIQAIANGDLVGGMLQVAQGAADLFSATRSCFTGRTKVYARGDWGEGWRRLDRLRVGDEVLSRDENDPEGPLVWKRVEAVFVTWALVTNLHVGGRIIETTAEHSFGVAGRGWTAAGELAIGDGILGMEREATTAVAGVAPSGLYQQVYNLRVADFHTYFVGDDGWGFSVWAHNAYVKEGEGGRFGDLKPRGKTGDKLTPHHMPQDGLGHLPRQDGGAVMMRGNRHAQTRTYGNAGKATKVTDTGVAFLKVLKKDIQDIRKIAKQAGKPTMYDDGIRDLLKYYKKIVPNKMKGANKDPLLRRFL